MYWLNDQPLGPINIGNLMMITFCAMDNAGVKVPKLGRKRKKVAQLLGDM